MGLLVIAAILGLMNSVVGLVKYQPEAVHIAYGGKLHKFHNNMQFLIKQKL